MANRRNCAIPGHYHERMKNLSACLSGGVYGRAEPTFPPERRETSVPLVAFVLSYICHMNRLYGVASFVLLHI